MKISLQAAKVLSGGGDERIVSQGIRVILALAGFGMGGGGATDAAMATNATTEHVLEGRDSLPAEA